MDRESKARGAGDWERKQRKLERGESERERVRERKLLLSIDITSIDLSNVVSLVTGEWF